MNQNHPFNSLQHAIRLHAVFAIVAQHGSEVRRRHIFFD